MLPATILAVTLLWLGPIAPARAEGGARPCPPEIVADVLAPASEQSPFVTLACSLRLDARAIVTKRIIIEGRAGSGVTLDCQGGTIGRIEDQPANLGSMIEIRSVRHRRGEADIWERPSDVTVRSCVVLGPIRVWGMGVNGQGEAVKRSSHALGHTERAQAAAPTRIRFENLHLHGSAGIPLYLAPGVTEVTVKGVRFTGRSGSTAIYLDAESARNRIEANTFEISTGREVIAVDGSAGNRIAGNRFRIARQGGIFLYRNCGEGGTVRHQTPSHNLIARNRFAYTAFPHFAAISVGARSGWGAYCEDDAGYPFGSSADNGDNATDNRLEANEVIEVWAGAKPADEVVAGEP